ncbi:MAG: biotin transporter BioY [Lachnospiraceae bacterium]|nr:biotin transporter BioY [Lachnospiraceae bacterium]
MNKNRKQIQSIVIVGMMTAILSVLSILQIPMPTGVPVTLQTFAVALCGYVLGEKKGSLAVALYLLLGLIGVPVYSGMTAGPGILFGMSGGFLFGFVGMTLITGISVRYHNVAAKAVLSLAGLMLCHLLGVIQFSLVTGTGFFKSILLVSLPYLIKDVLSVAGAYLVSIAVRKGIAHAGVAY